MKNWRLKVILLTVCCILIAVAVKYLPSILHRDDVSEVYRHYEHRQDLKVGFIKDYRIDDSTTVDVTTLTAKDSASWENLLREMNVSELLIKIMREQKGKGNNSVSDYYCKKGHPDTRTKISIPNCELVVVSPNEYCFYVFNVTSKEQAHIILSKKQSEIIHKKQKNEGKL